MIEKISMPSSIRLKYLTGVDTDGKEMFKTRTINNITSSVTDELIYGLKAMLESSKLAYSRIHKNRNK